MRHFFLARPVAALSRGMPPPPGRSILITLPGAQDRIAPGALSAVFGTINLAAVATAADQRLGTTTRAKEQPCRCCLGMRRQRWTNATIARILALHACPARCGARRRCGTAKLRSAPCLPSKAAHYYGPPGQEVSPLPISRPATSAPHRRPGWEPSARYGQRWQKRSSPHAAPDRRGFREPPTPG